MIFFYIEKHLASNSGSVISLGNCAIYLFICLFHCLSVWFFGSCLFVLQENAEISV